MRGTFIASADPQELIQLAAERVCTALADETRSKKPIRWVLSGGSTPRALYQALARPEYSRRIPWDRVHLFWGDERLVPHSHAESNYGMVREALLRHVPVPPANVHPVPIHATPAQSASEYEQLLREHFRLRKGWPEFDLVLLGMGADGHVASLFPHASTLSEETRWAAAARSLGGSGRVTLTLPLFNQAKRVFFLVTGREKAETLRRALEEEGSLPVHRVAPAKAQLIWFVDQAAAAQLSRFRAGA